MMMTKVKDELEAAELCKVVRSGRSMVCDFKAACGNDGNWSNPNL